MENHLKLQGITLKNKNQFLHVYEATYKSDLDGHEKKYEVISRKDNLTAETFGLRDKVDAVGIIPFSLYTDKILLLKEYRLACGEWVYNFPGGLIDNGETVKEATKRELWEETGLNLYCIVDILPPAYTAVGLGNESVTTVICKAYGEITKSTSPDEEIEAAWYTKEEVLNLIKSGAAMSLRTQSFLYMWATN